ncbi:MAG: hypothetical protein GX974_01205 [Clostridiales bacterium]|nr:hypothetical protein [Clostridiales bacterium]
MKEYIDRIGKYTFYAGVAVAIFGLVKSFMDRRGLPPGVCPIEDNRYIMYAGIILLLISITLDFVGDYKKKRQQRGDNSDE